MLFIKCLVQCLACNKIATTINFYYSCLLDFPVCLHTLVCILIPFLYGTPFVSTLIPFESLPMLKYSAHMLFFSSSPLVSALFFILYLWLSCFSVCVSSCLLVF